MFCFHYYCWIQNVCKWFYGFIFSMTVLSNAYAYNNIFCMKKYFFYSNYVWLTRRRRKILLTNYRILMSWKLFNWYSDVFDNFNGCPILNIDTIMWTICLQLIFFAWIHSGSRRYHQSTILSLCIQNMLENCRNNKSIEIYLSLLLLLFFCFFLNFCIEQAFAVK